MNELKIFNSSDFGELGILVEDGKELFPATECAKILGYTNPHKAINDHCRCLTKRGVPHPQSPEKMIEMNFIHEGDLYRLIVKSQLPAAEKFERWVFEEVLPEVRKTGAYLSPVIDSSMLFQMAAAMAEKEKQIALMKPKAEFFDAVADSKSAIEIGQAAKVLDFGKGRNTLFQILREEGLLMANNEPKQEYIDRGYFRVIEQKFKKPNGDTEINIKTLVYQKGLDYIRKLIERRKAN